MGRSPFILIMIALLVGGIVRFVGIGQHGIWGDEKTTITSATGFHWTDTLAGRTFTNQDYHARHDLLRSIPSTIRHSGSNALGHNFIVGAWGRVFGFRDGAIRSFSALAGLGTILLGALFFMRHMAPKERAGPLLALLLALLALHPLLVEYSRSARAYSFATFCCLGSTLLFFDFLERPGKLKIGIYLLLGLFSLTLHYFTFTVLASHAVVGFVTRRRHATAFRLYARFTIGTMAVLVLLLPLGYAMLNLDKILQRSGEYGSLARQGDPKGFALPTGPANLFRGTGQYLLTSFGMSLQDFGLQIRDTLAALAIPAVALWTYFRRTPSAIARPGVLFCAVVVTAYLLQAVALSIISGHLIPFQVLYQIFAVPFAACLLATSLYSLRNGAWKAISIAVVVALNMAGTYGAMQDLQRGRRAFNPFMAAADDIGALYLPGDTVIVNSWPDSRLLNLYLDPRRTIVQKLVPDTADPQIRLWRSGTEVLRTDLADKRY